ncbi:methyltransferase [Phellopilus nigrolimitatus]|nr:methyltransferase [Phellopilus nigrolimitatus]
MASPPVRDTTYVQSPPERKKTASSVYDVHAEQPPFGSRYLTADSDVWSKNAWDHVPPPDDQHERIAASLARQQAKPVPAEEKPKYNDKPAKHWDNFYKMNADNFFRNRNGIPCHIRNLAAAIDNRATELGCGAGNSVFPLLASNQNPDLKLHAFDYSSHAVKLVQHNELYTSPPNGSIRASVWDLTSTDGLPDGIAPSSMLKPGGLVVMRDYGRHDMTQLLEDNLYIRGDKTRVYYFELDELAELFTGSAARPCDKLPTEPEVVYEDEEDAGTHTSQPGLGTFKGSPAALLSGLETPASDVPSSSSSLFPPEPSTSPSFPSRTPQQQNEPGPSMLPDSRADADVDASARKTSSEALPDSISSPSPSKVALQRTPPGCPPHPLFAAMQLGVDRRLLVNRKRQLKMYRIWMQGKFKKLPSATTP